MYSTTLTPQRNHGARTMWKNQRQPGARFLLWVDGVGGYLVCLADDVVLGQAVPQGGADVPVLGDLSRLHATIVRRGESYVLQSQAATWVEGRRLSAACPLSDGDEVQLGSSFRLRFRRPHPLSATCRLDFLSHHRTQPAADGVLLMAHSCILGPAPTSHVVCRHWPQDVVLVRQGQQLRCHASQPLEVDGQSCGNTAPITMRSRVVGADFCLSLEPFE